MPRTLTSTLHLLTRAGALLCVSMCASVQAPCARSPQEPQPVAALAIADGQKTVQDEQQQDPPPEVRAALLRAMMILKIAPYVTNESDASPKASEPFRIAVVGNDETVKAIRRSLPGKEIDKRKVVVEVLTAEDASGEQKKLRFDLVYVASDVDAKVVAKIVASHQKLPTTLVCERPGFAKAGGDVQLFVENNGLRFEVNAESLKKKRLRASHHLLKLSKRGPER